ncbi:MAG: hypothetical protein V3V35_11660 [Dehalococcoidia bacterium]
MKRWMMLGLVAAMVATLASTALVAQAAPGAQDADGQAEAQDADGDAPRGDRGPRQPGGAGNSLFGWINQTLASGPYWRQFDRFLGAEFRFLDNEDSPVTAAAIPGTIVETGEGSITIEANDGSGAQTYEFGADPTPLVQRLLDRLAPGDPVIVVTVDGEARFVVAGGLRRGEDGADRPQPFGRGGRFGAGDGPREGQGRFDRFQPPGSPDGGQPFGQDGRFGAGDGPRGGQGRFDRFQPPGSPDDDQPFGRGGRFGVGDGPGQPGRPQFQRPPNRDGAFDDFRQRLQDRIAELRASLFPFSPDGDDGES